MDAGVDRDPPPGGSVLAVLRVRPFRRLYAALALSSVGDWLGLLAMTALAATLAGGTGAAANYALGGVLILRLVPALLFGPLAGVFADRFDRRRTMVVCDVLRFACYASIPLVGNLPWVLAMSFVVEVITLFWMPAKEAAVPNLLAPSQLEAANQLSLATAYGVAPVLAALLFSGLAVLSDRLAAVSGFFLANPVDLAILVNAATFAVSAIVVWRIREVGGRVARPDGVADVRPGMLAAIREGWSYLAETRFVRGLTIGILGAFGAAGALIGISRAFAVELGGGDAAYGLLFGALFVGLGAGVVAAPWLSHHSDPHRIFGRSLVWSGVALAVTALVPRIGLAVVTVAAIGLGAGIAFLVGLTILGREVDDWVRGRTFAFVVAMTRVVLVLTLAVVPFLVGALTVPSVDVGPVSGTLGGARTVGLLAGVANVLAAVVALRLMTADGPRGRTGSRR